LESTNPAIKKAAEVKLEEDLAPQKIKALKYLATVGCGCYPGVKEAFMAALDDCTEEVRYEAVQALIKAADNHCTTCNRDCCCDEEITLKLAEMAYERDDKCCYKEPSERVREAAAEALRACCPNCGPVSPSAVPQAVPTTPEVPVQPRPEVPLPETPSTTMRAPVGTPESGMVVLFGEPALAGESRASVSHATNRRAMPTTRQQIDVVEEPELHAAAPILARPTSLTRTPAVERTAQPVQMGRSTMTSGRSAAVLQVSVEEAPEAAPQPAPAAHKPAPAQPGRQTRTNGAEGTVAKVASSAGTVQVQFPRTANARVGGRVKVYHRFLLTESCIGDLEIVAVGDTAVTARPLPNCNLTKMAAGDRAVLTSVPGQPQLADSAMVSDRR
jgi:hypothetical protein